MCVETSASNHISVQARIGQLLYFNYFFYLNFIRIMQNFWRNQASWVSLIAFFLNFITSVFPKNMCRKDKKVKL